MIKRKVNRFLQTFVLIICNLVYFVICLTACYIVRLLYNRNEKHRSVEIVYRSENFLIVNKPYDMYINSNNPDRKVRIFLFKIKYLKQYKNIDAMLHFFQNTLQLELRKMLPDLVNPKLCHEFYFVHRLDYPTSGIICIALNKKAAQTASSAFENQNVQKFYLALVHGHIYKPHIVIDKPIGQHFVQSFCDSSFVKIYHWNK